MKNTCLSLAFLATTACWIAGCDAPTANNETDTEDTVAVDRTTEQITENEATDPSSLLYYAFMNNYMQTAMGKIAEEKAVSEKVKSLGGAIAEGNAPIMAQIEELAVASDIQLPQGLQAEDQQKLDSLTNLSGEQFDTAYVNMVLRQKNETIELMQELALQADNPLVQGLADQVVSLERDQIERAEIVQEEVM